MIVGCGAQARYVIDIVTENREYNILGLVDLESANRINEIVNDVQVVCVLEEIDNYFSSKTSKVIVAHGDFSLKFNAINYLFEREYQFGSAISSLAFISKFANIGVGCILNPNVVVMPNARVGDHVVIHSHSVVEHDNVIEDYCNLAPGVSIAGNVVVGKGSYIFTGASVKNNVCIGSGCIVAAGAVVTKDIADNQTVAGVPAEILCKK